MAIWVSALCILLTRHQCSAQARTASQADGARSVVWDRSFLVSPSISWVTTTQNQSQEGGMSLLSFVKSRSFCDRKTIQYGLLGSASDSNTSSSSGPSIVLASNDLHADGLVGFGGSHSGDTQHIDVTRNYLSAYSDMFMNNSLGIGLQQAYAINYQRYLSPCVSVMKPERFFSSVAAGLGYVNQRLYSTSARTDSAVAPLSAQMSYVITNLGQAPKMIVSAQGGYTPFLNKLHAYQAYANVSLQIPTRFPFLTVSLNEMDLYMNNAPASFKRNYESGSFQLTFSLGRSTNTNPKYPGACYTADTLSHLYCYDQVAASECSPPSVFRPGARCSVIH